MTCTPECFRKGCPTTPPPVPSWQFRNNFNNSSQAAVHAGVQGTFKTLSLDPSPGAHEPYPKARGWGAAWKTQDVHPIQPQDTATNVEKYFGGLCQLCFLCVRNFQIVRESSLVIEINLCALHKHPTLKRQGLKDFADELTKPQDSGRAEVGRLKAKVVGPLKA